jgi:hypothetical protein
MCGRVRVKSLDQSSYFEPWEACFLQKVQICCYLSPGNHVGCAPNLSLRTDAFSSYKPDNKSQTCPTPLNSSVIFLFPL